MGKFVLFFVDIEVFGLVWYVIGLYLCCFGSGGFLFWLWVFFWSCLFWDIWCCNKGDFFVDRLFEELFCCSILWELYWCSFLRVLLVFWVGILRMCFLCIVWLLVIFWGGGLFWWNFCCIELGYVLECCIFIWLIYELEFMDFVLFLWRYDCICVYKWLILLFVGVLLRDVNLL